MPKYFIENAIDLNYRIHVIYILNISSEIEYEIFHTNVVSSTTNFRIRRKAEIH